MSCFAGQKYNYQWHICATAVVLVAFVFLTQAFFKPILQFSSSSLLKAAGQDQYLQDNHGAVIYRKAPWKAGVGKWLSKCNDVSQEFYINETIGHKQCENQCSGHGVCNHDLGECRCFHGFGGKDCSEAMNFQCNAPASEGAPYGDWMVSICPAHCDTTRALCVCGEDSKYPNRPVAEACGFEVSGSSVNWSKLDVQIFTNDKSKAGWCNVDPSEAYSGKALFKSQCDCKYDGQWGSFCEIPVECSCINQCSGNGFCHGGFCQCKEGWYGIDCSIPSVYSSLSKWPQWVHASRLHLPDERHQYQSAGVKAAVRKRRPLVYIYDLPPEFNSHLLEGRHFRFQCVNRIYTVQNTSLWTDQLYGSQIALYESFLASPHRTMNAAEADFFFVPVLDSCIITRADDSPHLSMRDHMGFRSYLALDLYKRAFDHIMEHYPYWNRSSGRDHIWLFTWDEGACYAPKEIWNSMMLVHWGNTNSAHKHSTTAYFADNWDHIPIERRGTHPCYDPEKDLVIPAWKRPDPDVMRHRFWERPLKQRSTFFYFNGNLGPAFANSRPEPNYSMGIRQRIAEEFASEPNKEGKLGRQSTSDVVVVSTKSPRYNAQLGKSVFCGVFPGDGWSGRMEDSILQGCIPVIIQDGIHMPYENMLNYDSFSVRIAEHAIPDMIRILRNISREEIEYKLSNIRNIWQRFLYRDNVMLESQRQNISHGHLADWARQYSQLKDDDAFSTLLQVLHYKLFNDPWRRTFAGQDTEAGLPQTCIRA